MRPRPPVKAGDRPSARRWNALERAQRSQRITVTAPLAMRETAGGTELWIAGAGVGSTADFKLTSGITAATWSGGVRTAAGTGTGYQINSNGSISGTSTTIRSNFPDTVTVTAGKAKIASCRFDGTDWWLIAPNCVEVDA